MKTFFRKLASIFMILVMLLVMIPSDNVLANSQGENNIPTDATIYAQQHYKELVEAVKMHNEDYNVQEIQYNDVSLGIPFVIYELDTEVQDEIYYYPILGTDGNIILLMCVIGTTEGWNLSASEEWVNELNKIGGIKSDLVFYKLGENLWAEDDKDIYEIIGDKNLFAEYSVSRGYLEEKEKYSKENTIFKKTDINKITITSKNRKDTYTPAFSSSTTSSKICSLYNSKGQGNYGLCWAATVATICNYRKGTNLSASTIADGMNIGYGDGANIYEAQQALKNNGVQYNSVYGNSNTKMPWSVLKANIDNKYPIYVSAKATNSGHAVTAYGYTIAAGMKYIVLWNSGINGGKGSPITVSFYEDGTSFSYNNTTYTWTYSVSQY